MAKTAHVSSSACVSSPLAKKFDAMYVVKIA